MAEAMGVIVEYNPFHKGHLLHLSSARAIGGGDCGVVAVMSGNFVQRGEPAICSKFARAEMALRCGADIVIELPVYYAAASAEYFARGAVAALTATGICQGLCFGSESGDINALREAAAVLDEPISPAMSGALRKGMSWPRARDTAYNTGISAPNDILAVEYLRAIRAFNSPIEPFTIPRRGSGYLSESMENELPSALAIRKALMDGRRPAVRAAMPKATFDILERVMGVGEAPCMSDAFSHALHYILATKTPEELSGIMDVTEGLENRVIACAREHYTLTDIAAAVKTKRYTLTRVRRVLLHIILNITKADFGRLYAAGPAHYIRVLGFRRESEPLLRRMAARAAVPVVTNLKSAPKLLSVDAMLMLEKELEATEIYNAALRGAAWKNGVSPRLTGERSLPMVIV